MDFHAPKAKTALEAALEDMADLARRFPEAPRGAVYGTYDGQLCMEHQEQEHQAKMADLRQVAR